MKHVYIVNKSVMGKPVMAFESKEDAEEVAKAIVGLEDLDTSMYAVELPYIVDSEGAICDSER